MSSPLSCESLVCFIFCLFLFVYCFLSEARVRKLVTRGIFLKGCSIWPRCLVFGCFGRGWDGMGWGNGGV